MKKFLNLNQLSMSWNEKQKPQRFRRYAAVLMMLLTLGVGQMWAAHKGSNSGFWDDGGLKVTFSINGASSEKTLNSASPETTSLGTITTGLSMTKTVINFWTSYGTSATNSTVYWELYKSSTKIGSTYERTTSTHGSYDGSNSTYTVTTTTDILALTTGPGDYTVRVYAKFTSSEGTYWYNRNTTNGYYSFTFTIPSKNLTVAGAGSGNTVSGSVSGVTKGTAYTITATPTTGYTFGGWTKTSGGSSITIADASSATTTVTFSNYSNNATVTATFNAEETHDVTVSYKCGTGTIKTATTESAVGVTTARNVTAPTISGFTFSGWTVGSGVKNNSASTSTNPININSKGSGDYTLTANYTCDWELRGSMDSWESGYSTTATSATTVYAEVDLDANTDYSFKFKNGSTWYGVTGAVTNITYTNKGTARAMTNTGGGSPNQTMTSAGAGTYRFTWDITNKKVTITYPTSYTVELEVGTVKGNANTPKIYHTSATAGNEVTSGKYVAEGTKVIFWVANNAASAAKAGYNWWGFRDAPAGTNESRWTNNSVSVYTIPSISADAHIYAVFGENDYTVKMYNNGNGDVYEGGSIVTSTTAHVATASNTLTATPQTGYYFTGWDQFSDSLTINSPSTASTTIKIKNNKLGNNARLRANYSPQWSVIGTGAFGGWSAYSSHLFTGYTVVSTKDVGYHSITLAANTSYEIKVYDRQNSTTYGGSAVQTIDYAHSGADNQYTVATTASPKSVFIQSAAGGSYTLNWNLTDKKIAVVYPTSWVITTGQKTTGQADNAGGSFTAVDNNSNNVYGGKFVANNATVTFTATPNTGYNFVGWYSDASCETAYVNGTGGAAISGVGGVVLTLSSITADKTVYAKFEPKTYTVTLSQTGAASAGTANVTATYNAATPSIASLPTAANGYAFMGYYSAAAGAGTQFTDGSGNWVENIDDYIEDGKWIYDDDVELFAYFKKAEITELTLSSAIVAPNTSITVTPTISPTPTGTTQVCYEIQYSNGTALSPQPSMSVSSNVLTFTAPLASATYRIQATLETGSGACGSGTELSTYSTTFQVAGDHTVTVRYKCGDDVIKAATTVTGRPLAWSDDITAPTIVGYTFVRWDAGDGVSIMNGESDPVTTTTDATIKIKAIYDGTLTAVYSQKRVIYFYNTLNWENVYVYFYKNESYWGGSNQGTGANTGWQLTGYPYSEGLHGQMLPVEEGSKIYYFDAEAAGVNESYTNVAFTELNQHPCDYFYNNNKVVRRSDYYSTTMPLFVPLGDQTGVKMNSNTATYYNDGYWMNYPLNTGYTLKIYNAWNVDNATGAAREIPFPYSEDLKMPLKLNVEFNDAGNHNYWFMIKKNDGKHHGVNYTINQNYNDEQALTSGKDKLKLVTSAPGIYTFTLTYHDNGSGTVNYYIDVDFPVALNDYRIVYKDNATWSNGAHTASWSHPSDVITKIAGDATEAKKDTLSFYIAMGVGITPSMKFQYASAINESTGAITWTDVTSGSITIPSAVVTAPGVYNFVVSQAVGGGISVEKVEPYTGSYYIRTDCAGNTKWDSYKTLDHQMTYSDYAEEYSGYSHYFAHWVTTGQNVKFCIANDYSPCISDTIAEDYGTTIANITAEGNSGAGTLNSGNANIRFMWNQATNKISRAYIGGSSNVADRFLVLEGDAKMYDKDGNALSISGLNANEINLVDDQNFVYEQTIQVNTSARAKLTAKYNNIVQYFRGSEGAFADGTTVELLGGSASGKHKMRIVYDFKTNRLVTAYLPSGTIDESMAINADLMIVREHQEAGEQITFSGSGALSDVHTVYGVMRFNRWTLNNKEKTGEHSPVGDPKSVYERSLYWISFPFDVNLSDVFGFGTYGVDWIIEYYDGAERATNGYWKDSPGFWKMVMPAQRASYLLEAGKGYVLAIDIDRMKDNNTDFWTNNIEQVELFFPSATNTVGAIAATNVTTSADEHTCTIDRRTDKSSPDINKDRTKADSHWNMIGVPSYANYGTTIKDRKEGSTITWRNDPTVAALPYLYEWNMVDDSYTVQSGTTYPFKAMHSYMVQYYGNLYWSLASATPSSIVARRTYDEAPQNAEFRLELQQNEKMVDQTFVKLSNDEQVSADFVFDEDLCKEYNGSKANIYTFIENYIPAAGNTLPMSNQTTVVPVGVKITATGDYTFAIPDGTSGIGVTLIDTENNIRTSLSALSYTVNLTAGTHDGRFLLEIAPIQQTPTDIEEVTGDGLQVTGVRKVLIDQQMYIIRDGKMYDARGAMIK